MGAFGNDAKRIYAREANQFGTTATITRRVASAYSTATTTATTTATAITVKGYFRNPNRMSKEGRRDGQTYDSTDVRVNARIFVIPMLDTSNRDLAFIPGIGDEITVAGVTYSVRMVDPYFTDDVQTQMDLHVEQG